MNTHLWMTVMGLFFLTTGQPVFADQPLKVLVSDVKGVGIPIETRAEIEREIFQQVERWSLSPISKVTSTALPVNQCVFNPPCLSELKEREGFSYYLESSVYGLGSTFTVTLKLYDLASESQTPLVQVKRSGKRAGTTFEEITRQALQQLGEASGIIPESNILLVTATPEHIAAENHTATTSIKKSSTQRWWFWSLMSGLAIGAVSAAVVGLQDSADSNQRSSSHHAGPTDNSNANTLSTTINLK